jgi:hypothetical protein
MEHLGDAGHARSPRSHTIHGNHPRIVPTPLAHR